MNERDETEHVVTNSEIVDSKIVTPGQLSLLNTILENEDLKVHHSGQINESPLETNTADFVPTSELLNATYTLDKGTDQPQLSAGLRRKKFVNLSSDILQDSTHLRQAVYKRWYLEKLEDARRRWTAMKLKEKAEEDKKTKEQEVKVTESKAIYESWLRQKKTVIKKKVQEDRKKDRLTREKEEDKANRRREAKIVKVFNIWRERKDTMIKEEQRKKREERMEEAREKEDEMWEKKQDSLSAFQAWKSTKDDELRRKTEHEEEEKDHKTNEERISKEERDIRAVEAYEYWLNRKERKPRKVDTVRSRPPWCPN